MSAQQQDEEPLAALARWRGEIEEIDRRIVALIAERLAVAKQTARAKRAAGLAILDPQREAEVIRRAGVLAREHGLPAEAVREIYWQLVGLSRRVQESDT
ncbi:MAG: chorismate mutase [Gemmatimonadaceae bacterium]